MFADGHDGNHRRARPAGACRSGALRTEALGIGFTSVCGGRSSHDDSFGLLGLCTAGPVITVMIMGVFFDASETSGSAVMEIKTAESLAEVSVSLKRNFRFIFGKS